MIDLFISIAVDFYKERLSKELLPLKTVENPKPESNPAEIAAKGQNLKFPGKVLCIEKQGALEHSLIVIADSGNNRLILVDESTLACLDVIGSGQKGLVDGSYAEAAFHNPQGLCHIQRENEHFLYVCDTKNHAIREVNLIKKEVLTVIGTGEKGFDKEGNQ